MHQASNCANIREKISLLIASSTTPEIVLEKIAEYLPEVCQVDNCWIVALDSDRRPIQIAFWQANNQKTESRDETAAVSKSRQLNITSNTIFRQNSAFEKMLINADILRHFLASGGENSDLLEDFFTPQGGKAKPIALSEFKEVETEELGRTILGVGTRFGEGVNGVILLEKCRPYQWSDLDKQLLEEISEEVAIAIFHVIKTKEIANLKQQLEKQVQYQNLVNRLTNAIHKTTDRNQVLNLAIEETAKTLQVSRSFILLLKYRDPLFKTRSPDRIPEAKATIISEWSAAKKKKTSKGKSKNINQQKLETEKSQSFSISDSKIFQQAFALAPQVMAIADFGELPKSDITSDLQIWKPQTMKAMLLSPLLGTSAATPILGFLVLQQSSPRFWQPEELELVQLIGVQLSTAILQSQTIQQVQALVEERTAQLKSSMDFQGKLYEQTRRQLEQLRLVNQLKDEFLDTVQHELRTPLTKMKMAIHNLRLPGRPPERQAQYLDILEQQCNQEINLIQDLLTLRKLESQQAVKQLQRVNLNSLIEDLGGVFLEKWGDKGLSLRVDVSQRSLQLETDFDSLRSIFEELLTNAGKFSQPDTAVIFKAFPEGDRIVVTVSNSGAGILPEEVDSIFDKFRRGQGVTQQAIPGTGLGLALVKALVQHLDGTISVSSCPSANSQTPDLWETCFTLSLPQF